MSDPIPPAAATAATVRQRLVAARREEELRRTAAALRTFFVYGLIALAVVSLAAVFDAADLLAAIKGFFLTLGGSFLLAAAAGTLGGLLGFLFGVPPALQGKDGETSANTNLEQISDWLTKILVGVSLTQLTAAPAYLWDWAGKLSPLFGTGPYAQPITLVIMISAAVLGFFAGYLLTRLFLSVALTRADREASVVSQQSEEIVQTSVGTLTEASGALEDKRQALIATVEGLTAERAKKLLEKVEAAFDSKIGQFVKVQYPSAVRDADESGERARTTLARSVVLSVLSEADLRAWEAALQESA